MDSLVSSFLDWFLFSRKSSSSFIYSSKSIKYRRDHLINIFMYVIDFIMCKRSGNFSRYQVVTCYVPSWSCCMSTAMITMLKHRCNIQSYDYFALSFDHKITCSRFAVMAHSDFILQKLLLIRHQIIILLGLVWTFFSLFLESISYRLISLASIVNGDTFLILY